MARYYDMDKLKALIEAKADTLVEGKEAFLYVAKWLDLLPHEDVVLRSEVEDIEADRNKYQNWWCQTNSELEKAKSEVENYKQIAEKEQKLAMDRYFEIKRLKEELAELKKKYTEEK